MPKYELESVTLGELLADPDAVRVIEKMLPGVTGHPLVGVVSNMTASSALQMAGSQLDAATREQLVRELEAL